MQCRCGDFKQGEKTNQIIFQSLHSLNLTTECALVQNINKQKNKKQSQTRVSSKETYPEQKIEGKHQILDAFHSSVDTHID